MKSFDEFIGESFAIKHKKTGEILSTHGKEEDAKDEHSGLSDKDNYKVVKTSKKAKTPSMKE